MKILNVFTVPSTAGFFDGQFRYLTDAGFKIDVVSAPAEMEGFCQRNNVNFFPLNIARKIDIKADIKAIKELIKLIKNNKYDTVVGHTPKGALLAMIAARLSGTKNRIYFRHGYIFTTAKGKKRTLFKLIEKVTSLCSNKVINVSKSVKNISVNERLTPPIRILSLAKELVAGLMPSIFLIRKM